VRRGKQLPTPTLRACFLGGGVRVLGGGRGVGGGVCFFFFGLALLYHGRLVPFSFALARGVFSSHASMFLWPRWWSSSTKAMAAVEIPRFSSLSSTPFDFFPLMDDFSLGCTDSREPSSF